MYTILDTIDEHAIDIIVKYEEQQFQNIKYEYEDICAIIAERNGWKYSICVHHWIDRVNRSAQKPMDGYTATLQIDFTDNFGKLIEIDEDICSFFENITFIQFDLIRQKYRVFQNEEMSIIRGEMNQFVRLQKQIWRID